MQNSQKIMLPIAFLFTINSYGKNDLEQYYSMSQKATAEVCKGNYDKANEMFKGAFKDYQIAYFTDLNNALYSAIRATSVDSGYIKKLFTEIGTRGVSIRELYGHYPAYKSFIQQLASNNRDSLPAKDAMAVNQINDALIRDQAIRNISGKVSQPDFYTQDKFILPAVRAIDSANYDEVCALLRSAINKKVNLEQTIGYPSTESLFTILGHASPWGYYNRALLDSCVALGVLYSPAVATVYDNYCTVAYLNVQSNWPTEQGCHKVFGLYGGTVATQFPKSCYIFKMEDSILKIVNNRRKQLLLNDAYENARIVSYAFFFSADGFSYPGVSVISDRELEDSYENILKSKGIKHILYRSKADYDYNRMW